MFAVIEDDDSSRRILSRVIEKVAEVEVIDFSTAESFIRDARVNNYELKGIFLDIALPGISGVEAISYIKKIEGYADIPIVMCSATQDKLTIVKALKAGAVNFLVKPLTKEIIVKTIDSLKAS